MHTIPITVSLYAFLATTFLFSCSAYVAQAPLSDDKCTETTVAILGGGMAGIAAAQALSNASIDDFIILEYRDTLGGRVWHTDFGKDKQGKPYVIELGANWLQGLGSEAIENPVWALAKKYRLKNTYSNYSSIRTYNETGYTDYRYLLDEYAQAYHIAARDAGRILTQNLQDQTARTGLALAGWRPRKNDMAAQAVEWWSWDWEDAHTPETSSLVFGIAGENLTFNQFGKANHLVLDPRGYSTIIQNEALAAYAICTFSLGVLQNKAVTFDPPLPSWKQTAIEKFNMGTYTKIFMQFPETFWPTDTQFFLYASPTTRGYYPVFQSLSTENFLPESNILFATVVDEQAYRVERQSLTQTKDQILNVLREMFPDKHIPEPTAFTYPRWTNEPWVYGSYSNWPAGTTLEMHQNLRANTGRLWFAGEATSAAYFGFLHGAWYEGRDAGENVAALLQGRCVEDVSTTSTASGKEEKEEACGERVFYEQLNGTTPLDAYSRLNGWPAVSYY
ncbi:LysM domain family protein [Aspergillus niger]|uniref:LysM domain family protein n=1 Tax=Aspergillus niger TaxID=5061 RepID=A0A505IBX8_ASPNG|nr:LysM domain family protein [Aspergillus niger]